MKIQIRKNRLFLIGGSAAVFLVSYFTYFRNYWYPKGLFWDENYHITSAYKYLYNVVFLQEHPPLGKLFIALGERIFHLNDSLNTAYFLTTDHIKEVPAFFSFVGVRFFPVLFAMFSAILFFLILYKISKHTILALAFSSLYLFENALILQSRGAMLESIQIFFVLAAVLCFLIAYDAKKTKLKHYLILGLLAGAALSVKFNGAVMLLIFLPLFILKERRADRKSNVLSLIKKGGVFVAGVLLVLAGSYYVHAFLGRTVVAGKYYKASSQLKAIVTRGDQKNPLNLPVIIRDSFYYAKQYEAGAPKYNPLSPDENGSLFYTWPIGDKSINYKWEANNGRVRYLYLQGNPLIWLAGLIGAVYSAAIILTVVVFKRPVRDKRLFAIMGTLLGLYVAYMISMAFISRVLYLYHYFIPLIFSLLLFFSVYMYKFEKALKRKDKKLIAVTAVFIIGIVALYWFFSPLTYYQPLTTEQFQLRNWFPFWHLKSIN